MKKRYTNEQIAFALRQAESGTPVQEVCRKMGVTDVTFYRWKKKFAGMGVAELRRLRQLEEENRKLKQLVADLSLDKEMLQDVIRKKTLRPAQYRQLCDYLQVGFDVSERRACRLLNFSRTTRRYRSRADVQALLRLRIRDLAYARVSYGYRRIHILLRREGWNINHKRVYRLYREEGLSMRPKKPRRRVSCKRRVERVEATGPNEGWSMDFMHDELFDGRRFRLLTLVDNFSR